jgi:hypothetical protein
MKPFSQEKSYFKLNEVTLSQKKIRKSIRRHVDLFPEVHLIKSASNGDDDTTMTSLDIFSPVPESPLLMESILVNDNELDHFENQEIFTMKDESFRNSAELITDNSDKLMNLNQFTRRKAILPEPIVKPRDTLVRIEKQEEEMLEIRKKLENQRIESMERELIESLIFTIEPHFHRGIPSSASLLYKSILEFNCLSVNSSQKNFPKKIIKALTQVVEVNSLSNLHFKRSLSQPKKLCFWFSTIVCLINLTKMENPTIKREVNTSVCAKIRFVGDAIPIKFVDISTDEYQNPIDEFIQDLDELMIKSFCNLFISMLKVF